MTDNVVKFTPKPAPKAQDPWADMAAEYQRSIRAYIWVGFALLGGALLGVAAAWEKMK